MSHPRGAFALVIVGELPPDLPPEKADAILTSVSINLALSAHCRASFVRAIPGTTPVDAAERILRACSPLSV